MRRRKETLIMIIILVVLFLGIGYAYLTTTLSINGTTDVDANSWNIYWDNVQVSSGSVTGDQVITAPTIDTNKTTVSFHIRLKEPGEYYEFTVDAKNTGSIDAMIDTITKTVNNSSTVPSYLNYTVTYADNGEIQNNQLLKANGKETYKVRIEYKNELNSNDLPSTNQSLSIVFKVTYVQANDNAEVVHHIRYVYTADSHRSYIGQEIPATNEVYDTIEGVKGSGYYHQMFLRHTVDNDIITQTDIGFIRGNKTYYIIGGYTGQTQYQPILSQNIDTLRSAYYDTTCDTINRNGLIYSISCSKGGYSCVNNWVGQIQTGYSHVYWCEVETDGSSRCFYDN